MKRIRTLTYPIGRIVTGMVLMALMLEVMTKPDAMTAVLSGYGLPPQTIWGVAGFGMVGGFFLALGLRARIIAWAMAAFVVALAVMDRVTGIAALGAPEVQVRILLLAALLMIATHGAGGYALALKRG